MSAYELRVQEAKSTCLDLNMWIISTSDTCSGDLRLQKTRLRVNDIVNMVKNGDESSIYRDYPYVTKSAVDACLIYDYNHDTLIKMLAVKNEYVCSFLCSALGLSQEYLSIKHDPIMPKELDKTVLETCIDFISKCETISPNIIDKNTSISLVEGIITLAFPNKQVYIIFYLEENSQHSVINDTEIRLRVDTEIAYFGHIDWKESGVKIKPIILSFDEFVKLWK